MSATTTLMPGQAVWTKGGEYGDDATGGVFIRTTHDADPETGEVSITATVLTYQAAKPRQGSVHLLDRRGGNRDLGLVARLIRVPMSDIRPPMDDHRDWRKCWEYSRRALIAAALPPNDDIESGRQAAYVDAWRVLRDEAIQLRRGVQ